MKRSTSRSRALPPRNAPVRSRELVAAGLTRSEISRRVASGALLRVGRGLYARPGYRSGAHATLVEVAARAPRRSFACSPRCASMG